MSEQAVEPAVDDALGPISCLAVEFPGGQITGAGFDVLVDLVDRDLVRVLDLEFVAKRPDGSVESVAAWERAGARIVSSSQVAPEELLVALDTTEPG